MNSETKQCQNCKGDFTIDPDDFGFYEKIGVPAPTFCPECRAIRRMMWRNLRSLYKRNCNICEKSIISLYSGVDNAPVLCNSCWNSDKWDQHQNGKDYNFDKEFFVQLKELWNINPRLYSVKVGNLINSEYTNFSKDNKNVYLSFSVSNCEDVIYSESIDFSKNTVDSYSVVKLDSCFYNINCEGNYNTHYAIKSNNNIDSCFLYDCINCQNCFLSSNLRNKKYFFKNKQFSKEEYIKNIEDYKLNKFSNLEKAIKEFRLLIENNTIHKYASIYGSKNVLGDNIHNSKNFKLCFDIYEGENVAYSFRSGVNLKDSYDVLGTSYNAELIYEGVGVTTNVFKNYFCYFLMNNCRECEYSGILKNCQNCFGCFGLINAKYCILNKQYEKEKYFEKIEKIKKHMNEIPYIDEAGRVYRYGEFFPFNFSSCGYNETIANNFYPKTRKEALEKFYPWKDKEERNYNIDIRTEDIPDDINDTDESIIGKIIECAHRGTCNQQCTEAFKIIPEELQFYKRMNLPLPRLCPNCRHYERLAQRNPLKLWHRKCMKPGCNNEFETSYSPDRPEIVYCEKCYQQEVY